MPQVDLELIDWGELEKIAQQHQVTHIQLDPHNLVTEFKLGTEEKRRNRLRETAATYYRHTSVLDLRKPEDELLAGMKQKTRYNVKLGRKNAIKIELSDDTEALGIFLKLFFETVSRQQYFGRAPEYYRQIWQELQPVGKVKIAVASYEGAPIIAWMLFLDNNVIYYPYGGSSDEHRNLMANYALVWEIIEWGKQNGYHYFDLWGTLGENADEHDKEYGFHRFKIGFGGEQITYLPAYDMVISPFWYRLFKLANTARWVLLRVKKIFLR